jgi:hypothetical protein
MTDSMGQTKKKNEDNIVGTKTLLEKEYKPATVVQ